MSALLATLDVVYAAATALVFGGTAALSFASAPATFRTLKPVDAGRVFGRTLRTFDAMAFWASVAAVVAAGLSAAVAYAPPAIARAILATTIALLLLLVRRGIAPRMAALKPPETEDEERRWEPEKRAAFARLHVQYVRVYSANLFLSLGAICLHALERA
jgi:hypothetical protein